MFRTKQVMFKTKQFRGVTDASVVQYRGVKTIVLMPFGYSDTLIIISVQKKCGEVASLNINEAFLCGLASPSTSAKLYYTWNVSLFVTLSHLDCSTEIELIAI